MKNTFLSGYILVVFSVIMLSGCEVVGGIFKAGMWVGIIMVVAIVGLILYLISKFSGGKSTNV